MSSAGGALFADQAALALSDSATFLASQGEFQYVEYNWDKHQYEVSEYEMNGVLISEYPFTGKHIDLDRDKEARSELRGRQHAVLIKATQVSRVVHGRRTVLTDPPKHTFAMFSDGVWRRTHTEDRSYVVHHLKKLLSYMDDSDEVVADSKEWVNAIAEGPSSSDTNEAAKHDDDLEAYWTTAVLTVTLHDHVVLPTAMIPPAG